LAAYIEGKVKILFWFTMLFTRAHAWL